MYNFQNQQTKSYQNACKNEWPIYKATIYVQRIPRVE